MIPFLSALTAALTAFTEWVRWKRETYLESKIEALEDEMDTLAANGSPAAKLRMERISQRLKRCKQVGPV